MPLGVPPFSSVCLSLPARPSAKTRQVTERPEIEIQISLLEPELLGQLVHPLLELHERLAETLDLLVRRGCPPPSAERLALHELPQQLDQRQHELREPVLDVLGIGLDPARQRAPRPLEVACDRLRGRRRRAGAVDAVASRRCSFLFGRGEAVGRPGPVHANESSGWRRCAARRRVKRATSWRGRGTPRGEAPSAPTLRVRVAARAARRAARGCPPTRVARGRAAGLHVLAARRAAGWRRSDDVQPDLDAPTDVVEPLLEVRRESPRYRVSRSSRSRKPRPKRTGSTASFEECEASTTRACARTFSSVGSIAPSTSATSAATAPSGAT